MNNSEKRKTNCFQYYYTIKYITTGTIPHYVKHMNNVKAVHTKETIMTYNNSTEAVTQKHSDGKMLQKYAALPQKNIHTNVQIQQKPGGNNTEISGLHRCSPQNLLHTSRALPLSPPSPPAP